MAAIYAALGAIGGMLLIYMGLNFHIGSTIYQGVPAYIGAACGGAVVVLIVRYAVRKQYGPIIP